MKLKSITLSLTLMLFALTCGSASAATLLFQFSIIATEGPLIGTIETGVLSYDQDIIPSGGGPIAPNDGLATLSLSWNDVNYD